MGVEQEPTGFDTSAQARQLQNPVLRFLTHPVWSIVATLASLVAIPLAVILYIEAKEERDLVYIVHPIRTVVARGERPGDLKIEFMGQPLTNVDVVALQLALWNNGSLNIRPSNVLHPIEVQLIPPGQILEATITKTSRDIMGFTLSNDREYLRQGRIPISWEILEKGDGVVLQIIYAGPPDTNAKVTGVIEGQASPRRIAPSVRKESLKGSNKEFGQLRQNPLGLLLMMLIITVLSGFFALGGIGMLQEAKKARKRWFYYVGPSIMVIVGVAMLILGLGKIFSDWLQPMPPPGF